MKRVLGGDVLHAQVAVELDAVVDRQGVAEAGRFVRAGRRGRPRRDRRGPGPRSTGNRRSKSRAVTSRSSPCRPAVEDRPPRSAMVSS